MEIEITNIDSISEVSALLRDSTVSPREIKYDADAGVLKLLLTRKMWESSRRRGFFKRLELYTVSTYLTFENISQYNNVLNDPESDRILEMVSLVGEDNSITIVLHTNDMVTFEVTRINGLMKDTGEPRLMKNAPFALSFKKD